MTFLNNNIEKALDRLNSWLGLVNRVLEVDLIGGYALILHGIDIGRMTEDIDSVSQINSKEIVDKIHEIGDELDLPKWFDFGASSITLPKNYKSRTLEIKKYSNIKVFLLSIDDLIALKIVAFHHRRDRTTRDYEDLKCVGITSEQLESAIIFLNESYSPDVEKFKDEFDIEVEDTREVFLTLVNK